MLRYFSFFCFFLKFALFNIATAYHIYYRTKQSEQVCFILPKSIKKTSQQERKKQEEAKMKKRISMAIAVATAAATMASVSVPVMADDVNITIFNSRWRFRASSKN